MIRRQARQSSFRQSVARLERGLTKSSARTAGAERRGDRSCGEHVLLRAEAARDAGAVLARADGDGPSS